MEKKLVVPLHHSSQFEQYTSDLNRMTIALEAINKNENIEELVLAVSANTIVPHLPKFESFVGAISEIFTTTYIKQGNASVVKNGYFKKLFDFTMFEVFRSDAERVINDDLDMIAEVPASLVMNWATMCEFRSYFGSIDAALNFLYNRCKIERIFGWMFESSGYMGKFKLPQGCTYETTDSYPNIFIGFNPISFRSTGNDWGEESKKFETSYSAPSTTKKKSEFKESKAFIEIY